MIPKGILTVLDPWGLFKLWADTLGKETHIFPV